MEVNDRALKLLYNYRFMKQSFKNCNDENQKKYYMQYFSNMKSALSDMVNDKGCNFRLKYSRFSNEELKQIYKNILYEFFFNEKKLTLAEITKSINKKHGINITSATISRLRNDAVAAFSKYI